MAVVTACLLSLPVDASIFRKSAPDNYHEEIFDMSVDENVMSPEVPKKQVPSVVAYMKKVAGTIQKRKPDIKVESARGGLVIVATLPSDAMFAPNDTVLSAAASDWLNPFVQCLAVTDMFKVLVVAHSDDTGTDGYLGPLTEARAEAVVAYWGADSGNYVGAVVPYGFGAGEPVFPNDSRAHRARNRRIEVYLVPGPEMIARAKSGKLR